MTDYKKEAMDILADGFKHNTRDDGSTYYDFEETRDVTAQDLHGIDMLPDDWRFNSLDTIATGLSERDSHEWDDAVYEICDDCVDDYTHELLAFISSHSSRKENADEALSEGIVTDIESAARIAQHNEALTLAANLIEAANEIADELEEEAEESEQLEA